MKKTYAFETKIGLISVTELNEAIVAISFGHQKDDQKVQETPLLCQAARQIREYLEGERKKFDLPCQAQGSAFQKKVWEILKAIPYGETWTYQQVAQKAGNAKAARAVGMANHHNPLPIVIPCHRVIGSNGRLTGYAGGLAIKKSLLELESQYKKSFLINPYD